MNTAEPSIIALSSSTKSRLRSTQILTSLPQLISELVQNSLDAGARSIEVSIDPEEWECWVRDDGAGISRDGLGLLAGGSDAGRYGTSKAYTPASLSEVNTFGFRGEALASVADLCCLEISSRTKHSGASWSVILKGGQTLYAGTSMRWRRESSGTVVSVRDAFYNLPIRRKSHPNASRTIELVRKEIEAFALVFPTVSFSLENTHKSRESVQARTKARVLTIPKTSSTLATFRHLYGKALANHVEEIAKNHNQMRIDGFISLDGAHSKAYQFLYVNRHPLELCDLHRSIDGVFARSSFHKHGYDELGPTSTRSALRRSPRKTEKKAVYVLNLTIPPRQVDNCVEPRKAAVQLQDTAAAANFLSTTVEGVLAQHGFLVARREQRRREADNPSPRKKQKLARTSAPSFSESWTHMTSLPSTVRTTADNFVTPSSLPYVHEGIVLGKSDGDILWTDPATGETFIIDARTGNSYPQHAPTVPTTGDTSAALIGRTRRTLDARAGTIAVQTPAWITTALQANETYNLTERKIPAVTRSTECAQARVRHDDPRSLRKHRDNEHRPFTPWDASRLARFSRDNLRTARVLGQVDRKFIACILRSRSDDNGSGSDQLGHALVLIDQHAADERIRVERFLKDICEGFLSSHACSAPEDHSQGGEGHGDRVPTRTVNPPVHVLLTNAEAGRIAASQDVRRAFARWGVRFAGATEPNDGTRAGVCGDEEAAYVQVAVEAVPEVVADKLLSGDELRDLVKGFLAKLDADSVESVLRASGGQAEIGDAVGWQKALRWCPQDLIDLVNSKACRGAIMFNDSLTVEQCTALVRKLSETALPFQCAHGRPSLVPLVETGTGGAGCSVDSFSRIDWGEFMRERAT